MRPILIKIFLSLFLLFFSDLIARGQTCTGSLGDPVINETFGAGTMPGAGPALPANVTNYTYTSTSCPVDGSYTIATSSGPNACFGVWQVVPSDHTGDKNGYMMIVNGSFQPGIFYTKTVAGGTLCPNTRYEFAAWIANIMALSPPTVNYIKPNITFTISTADGRSLGQPYNTGDIAEVPQGSAQLWGHYGTYFTTPSDGADIVVTMTNNAPGGSGNDLILDDITFRPCGPDIHIGFGSIAGATDQNVCAGNSAALNIQTSQSGYSNPKYQWQVNKDSTGWVDLTGHTTDTLIVNKIFTNADAGTYQYRVGILDGAATSLSCRIYSGPINLHVNALPDNVVAPTQSACEGDAVQLTASGGSTYQWSGPNLPATNQNPVIIHNVSLADAGTYTVVVTSAQNCTVTASTLLSVYPKVTATISGDATICQGVGVNLIAGGGTAYSWTPGASLSDSTAASTIANPADTTVYTVKVSNANGCFDTKTVKVNVLQNAVANAGTKKTIFVGQSVKLNGKATGSVSAFYWTPADHLDNPNSLTPVASPVDNTTYTLHVISGDGCGTDTSSVFVRVFKKITIPNTFTPNNDGLNDYWSINNLDTYPDCQVTVFSRYGQQVYKSIGYNSPWNGTANGAPLPVGTYYYIIDLKNGIAKIAGWVLIVR